MTEQNTAPTTILQFLTRPGEGYEVQALADFIRIFQASLDLRLWTKLVLEEAEEVQKAFAEEGPAERLKELADLRYVLLGFSLARPQFAQFLISDEDPTAQLFLKADGIIAGLEIEGDVFTMMQLEEAFARVHRSNMSKLDDEGKPIFREDGKILKGPNYQKPDLSDLVEQEAA